MTLNEACELYGKPFIGKEVGGYYIVFRNDEIDPAYDRTCHVLPSGKIWDVGREPYQYFINEDEAHLMLTEILEFFENVHPLDMYI